MTSRTSSMLEFEKRIVEVQVTFLKLGEINTLKECFDADVLVTSRWREPDLDSLLCQSNGAITDKDKLWNPKIFIENVIGDPQLSSSICVEYDGVSDAYIVERKRFKGSFLENLELWEFPFDVQDLTVNVMSNLPCYEVEMVEKPGDVHRIYKQSFIDEQEWYLYKYIESKKNEATIDRVDPSLRRCSLSVRCRAARRPQYFIWNLFTIMILITCLSFVTFSVDEKNTHHKLTLTFTLVLTSVTFKFVANQSLPKVSYLTYLDRFILMNMILLAFVAFWHGTQTLNFMSNFRNRNFVAFLIFAGSYFLYLVYFILLLFFKPYRKRREMENLELQYMEKVLKTSNKPRFSVFGRNKKNITLIISNEQPGNSSSVDL